MIQLPPLLRRSLIHDCSLFGAGKLNDGANFPVMFLLSPEHYQLISANFDRKKSLQSQISRLSGDSRLENKRCIGSFWKRGSWECKSSSTRSKKQPVLSLSVFDFRAQSNSVTFGGHCMGVRSYWCGQCAGECEGVGWRVDGLTLSEFE